MQVVQVDHVHTQSQQRRLARPRHVGGRAAQPAVGLAAGAIDAELGGQLDPVAAIVDRAPHEHLVVAAAVDIGGVDQGDA